MDRPRPGSALDAAGRVPAGREPGQAHGADGAPGRDRARAGPRRRVDLHQQRQRGVRRTGRRAASSALETALEAGFGFEVTTFVRTAAELRRRWRGPFEVASGDTYFVTFLKDAPSTADAAALEALSNDLDLVVHGRDVHWRMHGKSTDIQAQDQAVGRHRRQARLHQPQHHDAAEAGRQDRRPLSSAAGADGALQDAEGGLQGRLRDDRPHARWPSTGRRCWTSRRSR